MWKQFVSDEDAEGPAYWEHHWGNFSRFSKALAFCDHEPVRPLLERFTKEGDRVLDGGFGLGQHCVYWRWLGRRMVGVDYSAKTASFLQNRKLHLPLAVADVLKLPFPDESFDAYFSGGVLEHFEEGPTPGLEEAHRILMPGGFLIGFMPFVNAERRLRGFVYRLDIRSSDRLARSVRNSAKELPPAGWRFHQYLFTNTELQNLLQEAGFKVVVTQSVSWQWGLLDVPLLGKIWSRVQALALSEPNGASSAGSKTTEEEDRLSEIRRSTEARKPSCDGRTRSRFKDFMFRVAVSEYGKARLDSVLVRLLQTGFGHMNAFVAQKRK